MLDCDAHSDLNISIAWHITMECEKKNMRSRKKVTPTKQPFVFSKNEFDHIVSQYQNAGLVYRINHIIVKNAKKHALVRGEKYSFYLHWPDSLKKSHSLKVTFSRSDYFGKNDSWVLDEKTLLTRFPEYTDKNSKSGQRYCSLSVKELIPIEKKGRSIKKKEIEILSFWIAMNGLVGELRDLQKGKNFSGNDVLSIYSYFYQIFRIKSTFICDASRLSDKSDTVRIPLRLLSSLCTGKTWYETKLPGVKLFECHQFKSARNGFVTQHAATRNKALHELRELRLSVWYEMLNQSDKLTLINLFQMLPKNENSENNENRRSLRLFINHENHPIVFGATTVQQLAVFLFDDSKTKRVITPQIEAFSQLLCGELHRDHEERVSESESDYWVKSRVKEILWGGFFWIKESRFDPPAQKEFSHGLK